MSIVSPQEQNPDQSSNYVLNKMILNMNQQRQGMRHCAVKVQGLLSNYPPAVWWPPGSYALSGGNNSTVCPHVPLPPNSTIHDLKHLVLEQHSRERLPCSLCALRGWFLCINCKDGSPSTWPHQGDIGTDDSRNKYHPCRLATVQYCTDEPWILVRTWWDSNWHKPSAQTTL